MPKWRKWQPIEDVYHNVGLLAQKGLYQIRMINPENRTIPIPRLCGVDPEGIVYIGKSIRLRPRIESFLKGRHSGGGLYRLAYQRLRKFQPYRDFSLQFRVIVCAQDEIGVKEANLLRRYFRRFGELPPFNSTVPGGK